MNLHYKALGNDSKNTIIILHGVFGSSDNWLSISKILSEQHKVYLLDARNHGQSPHSEEFSYTHMARDVYEFIFTYNLHKCILIGHSMGGKTVMKFNELFPNVAQKNIIVDISPRYYPPHYQKIINGLNAIPIHKLTDRREANEILKQYEPTESIRQFLLKNLVREGNGFSWKFNLKVLTEHISNISEACIPTQKISTPTLFIRGALSDYIRKEDEDLIKKIFEQFTIKTIENAGHWVHAENPAEFIKIVTNFLNDN